MNKLMMGGMIMLGLVSGCSAEEATDAAALFEIKAEKP